ncbi:hypothetical protein V1525DRAFT_66082 [Lipomyces kononenkoae]|uniref:Uncharacterized protein n=1 Tax=Lipomyces kononenkoae TaxID=34357 RepID=A0ACC3SRY8_LIPKO
MTKSDTLVGKRHRSGRGSRSSIACKVCHTSKIKCDVSTHGSPCSRCQERGVIVCELIQSRRGTYDRKEWLKKVKARKEVEERERRTKKMQCEIAFGCQSPNACSYYSSSTPTVIGHIQTAPSFEKPTGKLMPSLSLCDQHQSVAEQTAVTLYGSKRLLLQSIPDHVYRQSDAELHKSRAAIADWHTPPSHFREFVLDRAEEQHFETLLPRWDGVRLKSDLIWPRLCPSQSVVTAETVIGSIANDAEFEDTVNGFYPYANEPQPRVKV